MRRMLRELLTHLLLMARQVTLLVLQQLFQRLSPSGWAIQEAEHISPNWQLSIESADGTRTTNPN